MAQYLKATGLARGPLRATDFGSTGILPYFDRNIFDNRDNAHGSSCWFWSTRQRLDVASPSAPVAIVRGVKSYLLAELPWSTADFSPSLASCSTNAQGVTTCYPDYVVTRYFDGALFWKWRIAERDGFTVAVRRDQIPAADLPLPRVQYQLGMHELAEHHLAEARTHFEAALAAGVPVPAARFALAYTLSLAGQEALAREQLRVPECQGEAAGFVLEEVESRLARFDAQGARRLRALRGHDQARPAPAG